MLFKSLKINTALLILLIILASEQFSIAALAPEIQPDKTHNRLNLAAAYLTYYDFKFKEIALYKLKSGKYTEKEIDLIVQKEIRDRRALLKANPLLDENYTKMKLILAWNKNSQEDLS